VSEVQQAFADRGISKPVHDGELLTGVVVRPLVKGSPMTLSKERRRSVRVVCTESVEGVALNPGILFRGKMRDLSETGCYVVTRAVVQLEPGHIIELRFKIGKVEQRTLARVVQIMPPMGIRMEFVETGQGFSKLFRGFCHTQSLS